MRPPPVGANRSFEPIQMAAAVDYPCWRDQETAVPEGWGSKKTLTEAANKSAPDAAELFDGVEPCLDEVESEYLGIGAEKCKGLEDHSRFVSSSYGYGV